MEKLGTKLFGEYPFTSLVTYKNWNLNYCPRSLGNKTKSGSEVEDGMPYQRVLSTAPKRPRGKKAKQSLNWVVKKGGRSMLGGGGGQRESRHGTSCICSFQFKGWLACVDPLY
jgi:hypothetical protein